MKKYLVLILLFYQNVIFAQNNNFSLFCGKYTYISFRYQPPEEWPVFFDAIVKEDTIHVDITDLDAFTKSIYTNKPYVPYAYSSYQRALDIMCGKNIETYGWGLKLSNKFANEFNKMAKEGKIKLKTGIYVYYRYADVKAIFIELDNLHDWGTLSSIENVDFSNVNRMVLPISVIDYTAKEEKICITAN